MRWKPAGSTCMRKRPNHTKLIDALKRRRRAIDQKRCSLPCAEWRVGGPRYP
jgi:hypothetical protein